MTIEDLDSQHGIMAHSQVNIYQEDTLSSGYNSPVYRESSASYPPLHTMHQPINRDTIHIQLQGVQKQLQLQAKGLASQVQQPQISGLGVIEPLIETASSNMALTSGGVAPVHVLLVVSEPSLGAIFQQALSQTPVPSLLYIANALDLWTMIEHIKTATGRLTGPEVVFFQPEVLIARPGTVLRLKQTCGASCTAVVLQGSEPIAHALQADDFLAGPTPTHALRKEDLALMLLKWRSRKQAPSGSTSTSAQFTGSGYVSGGAIASSVSSSSLPMPSALASGSSSPPRLSQMSQLQALQAKLQALQQAKQDLVTRTAGLAPGISSEIEPLGLSVTDTSSANATASSASGLRFSPPWRPPPLRLASAGVAPSVYPSETVSSLARASSPPIPATRYAYGQGSAGSGVSGGVPGVTELVAQLADLRRKLGNKPHTPSMMFPAALPSGGGTPNGSVNGTAISSGNSVSGGASSEFSQPPQSLHLLNVQAQRESLQQMQQNLQRLSNGGGFNGGGNTVAQLPGGSSVGTQPTPASVASNRTRRLNNGSTLQPSGSMVRPSAATIAAVAAASAANISWMPPAPLSPPTGSQPQQLSSLQLQQQLMQLQQLQLQQVHRLGSATAGALDVTSSAPTPGSISTMDAIQGPRLRSTSPTGSLGINQATPEPNPAGGALSPSVQAGTTGDSSSVSRSSSFIAAGGTRYRPPRQRSPSPLSGTSGHISDSYPGLGTSRFASPQFRSGSGSGSSPITGATTAGGVGGQRRMGASSGHTSDSGFSLDPGASVRDSTRSGSTAMMSKSGDDAIAAALSAASDAEGDSPPTSSALARVAGAVGSVIASGAAAASSGTTSPLDDVLRSLEATGDGGSSTDGRSLMDASFALEDSGNGGRGSISGGAASSIDLQPSPRPGSSTAAVTMKPGPQSPLHSHEGAMPLGSNHRSSVHMNTLEDIQPLRMRAALQPVQPPLTPSRMPSSLADADGVRNGEAQPTVSAGAAEAVTAGAAQGQKSSLPAVDIAASGVNAGAAGSGQGSAGPSRPEHSATDPRVTSLAEGTGRPSLRDHGESQQQPQQTFPEGRGPGARAVAATMAESPPYSTAPQPKRPERTGSQEDNRLPSIDGSQPIPAAATRGTADGHSSSFHRQASARSGVAAASVIGAGGPFSDSPSTDVNGKADNATSRHLQSSAHSNNRTGSQALHKRYGGPDLAASIEGSIIAGLPLDYSRGVSSTGGDYELLAPSSGTRVHVGAGPANTSAYCTDDIFSALHVTERRQTFSPLLPLSTTSQPVSPARPPTPPARRAARILLCSHPIVITREDFLPI